MQGRRRFGRELLPVEKCEVGAVLVLNHVLAIFDKDARVHARNAAFFSAVGGQVHVGEDVADGIFAPDQNVVFAAQVVLLVIGFDDETGI